MLRSGGGYREPAPWVQRRRGPTRPGRRRGEDHPSLRALDATSAVKRKAPSSSLTECPRNPSQHPCARSVGNDGQSRMPAPTSYPSLSCMRSTAERTRGATSTSPIDPRHRCTSGRAKTTWSAGSSRHTSPPATPEELRLAVPPTPAPPVWGAPRPFPGAPSGVRW